VRAVGVAVSLLLAAGAAAFERTEQREPCRDATPERRAFFGDTHVHTAYSFDAWGQGTRNTPADAYRFARGERVGLQPYGADGRPMRFAQLRAPLDFAMVSDHAERLGETRICSTPGVPGHDDYTCWLARRFPALGYALINSLFTAVPPSRFSFCGEDGARCREQARRPWAEIQRAAEEAYDRSADCSFTAFVGYEWTAMPYGFNLHRNVVFRNDRVPEVPASYVDHQTPEALWRALERGCIEAGTGCDALAIPHNGNVSNGWMFRPETSDGSPLDASTARRRARLEPLVEITQHKGTSECRGGNARDELCDFEVLPYDIMEGMAGRAPASPTLAWGYAREGLLEGLRQERRLGVNPFAFGMIGATDGHMGLPGLVDEADFPGHAAGPATARVEVPPMVDRIDFNPGGLAGVWAEENSRDALFEAMRRRETFATSGPRLQVRFFGGAALDAGLCAAEDFAARGYAQGVPMGGELRGLGGAAPRFALKALADPGTAGRPGTSLQHTQVVKLSLRGDEAVERVFEVGGDPDAPADLDLASCRPGREGPRELCDVWVDPEFDPTEPALYYARVLESPSCRWTAHVCRRAGIDCAGSVPSEYAACCDPAVPETLQERAWTSPIWYTPSAP